MAALEGRWESGGAPLLILEGLQGLSGRAQLSFKSPPPAPLIGKSPSLALHQAGHEPCPARQPWVSTDPLPSLCEDVEQPERRRDHGHRACPMACPLALMVSPLLGLDDGTHVTGCVPVLDPASPPGPPAPCPQGRVVPRSPPCLRRALHGKGLPPCRHPTAPSPGDSHRDAKPGR